MKIKNRSKARKSIRNILIVVEIIVLLCTSVACWAYGKYGNVDVSKLDVKKITINDINEEVFTGYTNIALFGLDSRDESTEAGNNSDTIIICSINNETNEIKMASVYRDTYLVTSDFGGSYYCNKANSAYCNGGPERALSMLNQNLDLNLKDYITTNWAAMITAIDMMGGLDLEMTSDEVYWMNGYQLETAKSIGPSIFNEVFDLERKNGTQHCNGVQATAFCRIRYTEGDDYKRTERQRYVIEKIFEKAKTLDLEKLNDIATKVFPMVSTNITFTKALKLGTRLLDFKIGQTYGFPYEKTTGYATNGGDCVFCKDLIADVTKLHKDLFNETNYSPSSTVTAINQLVSYDYVYSAGGIGNPNSYSNDSYSYNYNSNNYSDGDYSDSGESYTEENYTEEQ